MSKVMLFLSGLTVLALAVVLTGCSGGEDATPPTAAEASHAGHDHDGDDHDAHDHDDHAAMITMAMTTTPMPTWHRQSRRRWPNYPARTGLPRRHRKSAPSATRRWDRWANPTRSPSPAAQVLSVPYSFVVRVVNRQSRRTPTSTWRSSINRLRRRLTTAVRATRAACTTALAKASAPPTEAWVIRSPTGLVGDSRAIERSPPRDIGDWMQCLGFSGAGLPSLPDSGIWPSHCAGVFADTG